MNVSIKPNISVAVQQATLRNLCLFPNKTNNISNYTVF